MPPKPFAHKPPKMTDFTPLVSKIPKLLRSEVAKQLQDDRKALNRPLALEGASQVSVVASRDSLSATIDTLRQANQTLDALRTYFDAAEEHATRQLSLHQALLSPIRRLPNEVLQLIFIQVHAASHDYARFIPITTQVCSYWRQVAEVTPFLWSSIDIDLTTPEGVEAQLVGAEARLQKARNELLSVRFSQSKSAFPSTSSNKKYFNHYISSNSTHLTTAVAFLVKHRDRLESIAIMPHDRHCDVAHHLASQCHPVTGIKFKNLRTLRISFKAPDLSDSEVQALCNASPVLEKLHTAVVPKAPAIPWENITEFKGKVNRFVLAQLCSRARHLQRADIYSARWNRIIEPNNPSPVMHAFDCLMSLSLKHVSTNCLDKLASIPPPPALRHLSVCTSPHIAERIKGQHLISLLNAWGSELEYFASGFVITSKELKTALEATPKLQGLRLLAGDYPVPSSIFTILPALTHLELHATVHEENEGRFRKLLSRPLNPKSSKRLALQSIAFYAALHGESDDEDVELPESTRRKWEQLAQDLRAVGLRVYEHRSLKTYHQASAKFGFNSEFFKDRSILSFI